MSFLLNFHFLRPWLLLLLLIPFVLLFLRHKKYGNASSWENVCDKDLLPFLLIKGTNSNRRNMFRMVWIALVCAIIAASGPSYKQKQIPPLYEQNPVMLALNLSTDMENQDIKPSRLARSKYLISDLLKTLPDTQIGMIVYSSEPFEIMPISEDAEIIENILPSVEYDIMPENGSRIDRAVSLSVSAMKNAGFSFGNIVIITSDAGSNVADALKETKDASEHNFSVNVVDISYSKNDLLQQIAAVGGGKYINLSDNIDILSSFILKQGKDRLEVSKNLTTVWEDAGYYLLFIPLFCVLLMFRRGILTVVVLFVLMYSQSAQAGFFRNKNQEALKQFSEQDYTAAAEKFDDARWQGASLYKANKFDEAYEKFFEDKTPTGLYNQGNALAKAGKIEDAIKKYEDVLEKNPEHEDAKFNLEYLKQQQQSSSSSSQNNQDNKENQDNNNSQNSSASQQNINPDESNRESKGQASDNNEEEQDKKQSSSPQKNQPEDAPNQRNDGSDEQSTSGNQGQNTEEKKDKEKNRQNKQDLEKQDDEKNDDADRKASPSPVLQNENKDTTSEEVMVRARQYQQIEADPGGLLRAFIEKEYQKNRYGK